MLRPGCAGALRVRLASAGVIQTPVFPRNQIYGKCLDCQKQFSVKVNSIFEDSPIGLDKWLCAMWLIANCKNGVSSYEIARDVKVHQKAAWFMLQRIRHAMQTGTFTKLKGENRS